MLHLRQTGMDPQRIVSARRSLDNMAWVIPERGVSKIKDSAGSPMGDYALHTVIGRNSRQRKGLEPSRRLSETTGPQSPSAFRIAFQTTPVTERAARCKHEARYFTHRAPKARRYRPAPESVTHVTANCREPVHTLPQLARRGAKGSAQREMWSGAHVTAHAPDGHVFVAAPHRACSRTVPIVRRVYTLPLVPPEPRQPPLCWIAPARQPP